MFTITDSTLIMLTTKQVFQAGSLDVVEDQIKLVRNVSNEHKSMRAITSDGEFHL